MIKTDPKPHKKADFYYGTVQLDQEYKFEVCKTTNGSTTYEVTDIQPLPITDEVYDVVEATIINYCNREGLGQIENK
jgi:hypothetical protein